MQKLRASTRKIIWVMAVGVAIGTAFHAHADSPATAPSLTERYSPRRTFCAASVPDGETELYRLPGPDAAQGDASMPPDPRPLSPPNLRARCVGGSFAWSIPGWYRSIFVADDGTLATAYDGVNLLLPEDARAGTVMLVLWRDARRIAQVQLSEILPDLGALRKTVSHYQWGYAIGFDDEGRLEVHTVDDRIVRFDTDGRKLR